jgi:hypothetical protein
LSRIRADFPILLTEKNTYRFPFKQIVLAFTAIPFEPGGHVHARPDQVDSVLQTLRNKWIIHLALCYGFLSFDFASFHELATSKPLLVFAVISLVTYLLVELFANLWRIQLRFLDVLNQLILLLILVLLVVFRVLLFVTTD